MTMSTLYTIGGRHRRRTGWRARPGAHGFILPVMLLASLLVVLGAALVTSRALDLKLGVGLGNQARGARDAADSGMEAVIAELNRPENRRLAGEPIDEWNAIKEECLLQGSPTAPCPSDEALALGKSSWRSLPADTSTNTNSPSYQYRIYAAELKGFQRKERVKFKFSTAEGTPEKTVTSSEPVPPRYLQLTVEGQSVSHQGSLLAKSRITQEMELEDCSSSTTPPWCLRKIIFRSAYGNT